MHSVLNTPPAWVLVWSMVQGKVFPVGRILCSILRAAPALLQGLASAEGSGLGVRKQDQSRQTALSVHSYNCFSQECLESMAEETGALW